jgi:hypothetical protein
MSTANREMKRSGLWINLPRTARSYDETMLVELWLNNDQRNYELLWEASHKYRDIHECAEWLVEELRQQLWSQTPEPSLWSDLMTAAFSRVNWLEIIRRNR